MDLQFIRNFAAKRFDCFDYFPAVSAPGAILVCWTSKLFTAFSIEKHPFAITVVVTSTLSHCSCNLAVVYGPCRQPVRDHFIN
jgi:hypothetical protein